MERLNETAQDWVPHVRRLRPDMAWEDVLRIINGPLPHDRHWTQSRLLRAVQAYVRDGFLPAEVLARAKRRDTDDRLPAIIAAIKGADPDITLQAICERLSPSRNNHVITFQKRGCGGLPAEPCVPPAICYSLIQVQGPCPWMSSLDPPLDQPRSDKNGIRFCEFCAFTKRRGTDASHWAVCPEPASVL